jgi:hypothetical protein
VTIGDDVVAAARQAKEDRADDPHPRGGGNRSFAAFQLGDR